MRPRVFVTRVIPQEGLDMIRCLAEVEVWPDQLPPPRAALLRGVRHAEGLLCLLTDPVDAELMDASPHLRVISNYAAGHDNIDVAAATERGILVGNTPGVLTETVADLAFALLLAAARRIVEGARYVRQGKWRTWDPTGLLGQDVHGATLGIVGLGRIGTAVARRAGGFDMRILYYDVRRREDLEAEGWLTYTDLDTLLAESDFVTVHVPLTPRTKGLFSAVSFARMKPTAIFINASRGPIVDQHGLYQALSKGQIRAAALDVTDPEPISADDPLLTLDNVIVVPHIGSASVATRTRMAVLAARNLIAGLLGEEMPHCINPEACVSYGDKNLPIAA